MQRLPDNEQRPRLGTEGAAKITGGRSTPSIDHSGADTLPVCRVCGHPLTAEKSVRRLLGPVCARHEVERVTAALRGAS